MKNILLLVHDDVGQEPRLQAALDLTRGLDGHLTCLDLTFMPPVVEDGFGAAIGTAILLADEERREQRNRLRIRARLAQEDVRWSWIERIGFVVPTLADEARLADLIVVSCKLDLALRDMRHVAGDLLFQARKPVVAVPEQARGFAVRGHALVAWNGSPEAAAALCAAVPLLQRASRVTLLEVDDGTLRTPAEEAATLLSRSDVHASIRRETGKAAAVGARILDACREPDISYLVMGGYGRSRLREMLFGGVTRTMLNESPVPLFLAH